MFWHKYNKGEIATTLTLITIAVLTAGIFAGTLVSQRNTDTRSRAASTGDGFLVCDAGSDPYNSSSITVTNKTSETIVDIQSVMWSCKYDPNLPIEQGRYKCETCTSGDEIGNPNCQVGVHDPTRSTEFTLAPGESKTISHTAKACETVQFDVYNQKEQGESPTECYNVSTTVIDPPAPNWWQGGIGFAINQNSNCTGGGYLPPGTVPTPTPTVPSTAQVCTSEFANASCQFESTCITSLGPVGYEVKSGNYDCKASGKVCCAPKVASTPTPKPCQYVSAAECTGLCGKACTTVNGCPFCPGDPTLTPTPTRTPTPRPTFVLVPSISSYQLSCSNIQIITVFNDVSGNQMVVIMIPQPHRLAGTYIVPVEDVENKTFRFGQIWLDNVVECQIPF